MSFINIPKARRSVMYQVLRFDGGSMPTIQAEFCSGLRMTRGERTYLREVWVSVGERDEAGEVWRYDVKAHKGTMPAEDEADI